MRIDSRGFKNWFVHRTTVMSCVALTHIEKRSPMPPGTLHSGLVMHRVGDRLVVGSDDAGFFVTKLSLREQFDDLEEAIRVAEERKKGEFVDAAHRGW